MRNRASYGLILLLLLLIIGFVLASNLRLAEANTITVPDDYITVQAAINAANPGDTVFVKAGIHNGQVVINQSISLIGENRATTIINETSEIGDGHVVIVAANGVLLSNFTIKGHRIPEPTPPPDYWVNGYGIFLRGYNNTAIVNNDLANGGNANAMTITNAVNITLIGNVVRGNIYGVILRSCTNIILTNNDIRYNYGYEQGFWGDRVQTGQGLYLDDCYNATMRGNIMQENCDDFCITGEEIGHFLHDIDTSNLLLDGTTRRIYYLINQHGKAINLTGYPDLGCLALVNSTNIDVQGFDLLDNTPAILLAYTNNSLVRNNTIRWCTRGIVLVHSSNNTIFENTFNPNNTASIRLEYYSTNNTIANNTIHDNYGQALYMTNSSQNMIANNNMTDNADSIFMVYSDNNTLNNNNLTNSGEGIFISYSSNMTLRDNVMKNNSVNFRVVAYYDTNLFQFTHDIDPSNLVDGEHIYYLINYTGSPIDSSTFPNAGFLALVNSTGATVEDLELRGMLIAYTNNTLIQENALVNGVDSITMVKSSGNSILENNITDNSLGIHLYDRSNNNTITKNNVTDVSDGISLNWYCDNNTITNNRVTDNYGEGISVESSNYAIITGNYAVNNSWSGIQIYYYSNSSTVMGNSATNNGDYGISLHGNNNTIADNYVAGNRYDGIRADGASNNTISGNKIKDHENAGIAFRYDSYNNTVVGNDISNSTRYGIQLYILPTNNTIIGNNITDSGQDGISIEMSGLHLISGNNITNSTRDGIHVEGFYETDYPEYTSAFGSMYNNITWNNVTLCGRYGIYMEAYNNTIHHNRFAGYIEPTMSDALHPNIWDDGYPSGGNYWSGYVGTDLYHGPLQNILGGDGIADTPYAMNANNTDHYPLLQTLPYTATITAHCNTEASDIAVAITEDGVSSGYNTPHSFANLEGTHTFTVPSTDSSGHPFKQWSTGQTSTTITVSSGGTYTAYYEAVPVQTYNVTIIAHCNAECSDVNVPITMDGSPTNHATPYTFTGLSGTHTFTVPNTDALGHTFYEWSTGYTGTTITVSSAGAYTARYELGVVRKLTVTSPNGGESWVRGTTHAITWTSTGSVGANVKIEVLKSGVVKGAVTTANDGYWSWTISSSHLGTDYKIRITSTSSPSITDSSDNNFTITDGGAASLTVTSPNGGESWVRGTAHPITWTWIGSVGANVKIEVLKSGVVKGAVTTANDGSYSWTISSSHLGTDYKVRITSTSNPAITDSSDNNFTIVAGTLTVASPNGGESWKRGTVHTITWSKSGSPGSYVKIELLKGGVVVRVITSSTANDGSCSWTIPSTQTAGTDYRIRITSTTYSSISDSSNSNFAVTT